MAAPIDIALQWDETRRQFDVAFSGRDFAIDTTPASAMLVAMVCDRRAAPDDELPQSITDFAAPGTLTGRRGWCCDFLDPLGRLCGSRFWLLDRAKQTESTRQAAETYGAECLSPIETRWSVSIRLTVRWLRKGVLALQAQAGAAKVSILKGVAGPMPALAATTSTVTA